MSTPWLTLEDGPELDGVPEDCVSWTEDRGQVTCLETWGGENFAGPELGAPFGLFGVFFVLVLVGGIAATVWRVSTARRLARDAGMDEGDAARMALLTDNGLEAAYVASQVRGTGTDAPASRPDAAARLRELEQLRAEGLITEDEYTRRREAVIDGI